MKGFWVLLVFSAMFPSVTNAVWKFSDPLVVAEAKDAGRWLQLQSSGRKNIDVTADRLGITYERYDKEKAEIYLATLPLDGSQPEFKTYAVRETDRPHDPVIRAAGGRFVVGWVDGKGAWLRTESGKDLSPPVQVRAGKVNEFTFAADDRHVYCYWTERVGDRYRLLARSVTFTGPEPALSETLEVAPVDDQRRQRQPAAAAVDGKVVVAWQDRSTGTSVIYAAVSGDGLHFGEPAAVNETIVKSTAWGKGSSAVDGVFATSADDKLVLAWLDKRSSRSGYKVYASVNRSLSKNSWKPNKKIEDEFGDFTPQWNPALSDSRTSRIVAAWSDSRDDTPDIWIADYQGGLWSDNQAVDIAATDASETDPSLVVDATDVLHLVWVTSTPDEGQRILYSHASR